MSRLSTAERSRLYGQPGSVATHRVRTPWGIVVTAHARISEVFLDACHQAAADSGWTPRRIDSYANRTVRGSSSPSLHSYALAWDFFATGPTTPPPGGVWTPDNGVPPEFARCFVERGFTWGATWQRKDVPHIEWAGAPPSGRPWRGSGHTEDSRTRGDDVARIVDPGDGGLYVGDGAGFRQVRSLEEVRDLVDAGLARVQSPSDPKPGHAFPIGAALFQSLPRIANV